MDVFRYFGLIFLFRGIKGDGFVISDSILHWKNASNLCQLAEPDLIFSSDGVTVNAVNTDVWVGYYQTRTAFEYFGCTEKGNYIPRLRTRADPGQCMSACGAQKIIGICENECFCFEQNELENTNTLRDKCKKQCKDQPGLVCGDSHGPKYMSLYRSIGTGTIYDSSEDGNCMYYDHNGFHPGKCTQSYAFICGKGSRVWIENGKNNQHVFGKWTFATAKCFKNGTRPSTYSNTKHLNTEMSTSQLWTGVVRSQVIYKYTNDPSHLRSASKYGYIERDGDDIVLKFANVWEEKKSLCVNDTSSSTAAPLSTVASIPPNSITSTATNPKTTVAPVRTTSSLYTTPISSTTTIQNSHTSSAEQQKDKGGSSDVGAIVGATLSIVVVFVIVIVVALFLRKRGIQLPFIKKEKHATRPNNVQNNNDYVISRPVKIIQSTYHSDQDEYAEIDLTTTIDNEAGNETLNHARESSDYSHDYVVLEKVEEETYDSTKPKDQKSDPNTFNPYNKLSFGESFNYDHIGTGAGNAGRKVSDSENTYNTTSIGNSYLKTKVGEPNNAYNMTEDPEDTYNHTNIPRKQLGLRASENDYDAI